MGSGKECYIFRECISQLFVCPCPYTVSDVHWALTKVIFPEAIESLGWGSFLHKPQIKVLLQTMWFQRACSRVLKDRCACHKIILLSLMGSASHTSILRAQGYDLCNSQEIQRFLLILSLLLFQSDLFLQTLPVGPWTHQMSISHTPTHHMFLLILFGLLNLPCFTLSFETLTQNPFSK